MKFLVSLLGVIALIGAAIGDESGDAGGSLVCLFPAEELSELRPKLYDTVEECISQKIFNSTGVDVELEYNNSKTEQIVTAFNTRCANRVLFDQCWEDADLVANACFDASGVTKFRLFRKFRAVIFEVGCADNGMNAAKMFEAKIMNGFRIHDNCADNATAEVVKPAADDQDLNAEIIYKYKILKKVLECLDGHKGGEHDDVVNLNINLLTEIKDKMKCLKDGADILCKTMVENNN